MHTIIEGGDIHKVNWCGLDLDIVQMTMMYDTTRHNRSGMLVFDPTYSRSVKDLARTLRRTRSWSKGDLFIRAYTKKYGLWELTLKETQLKDMTPGVIWFHHDGRSSLVILEDPKT